MAAVRAYALRVGAASALAFALAVLRLVIHAVRESCGGWGDLEGENVRPSFKLIMNRLENM